MTKRLSITTLCLAAALTLLVAGDASAAEPSAAPAAEPSAALAAEPSAALAALADAPSSSAPTAMYGQCWRRLGPFATQYRAYQVRAYARSRGYGVGPVYGQGGVVTRYGRRYYFRVYYRC